MRIAIIGPSCSGKTKAARALSELTGYPVRHCGEAIKNRARKLGLDSPSMLTVADHQSVDAESRDTVASAQEIIIEGTFLDCVLEGFSDVYMIILTCDVDQRAERHQNRSGKLTLADTINDRDQEDARLRLTLYPNAKPPKTPHLSIDTTGISPETVARRIAEAVGVTRRV